MDDVDDRKALHTESTRLTWRHFTFARDTAIALANNGGGIHDPIPPVLALANYCLRLYAKRPSSASFPAKGLDAAIRSILAKAAGASRALAPPRPEYALAVLHFVERLIGLESTRPATTRHAGRRRYQHIHFSEHRRRPVGCGTYATPDFISNAMVTSLLDAATNDRDRLDVLDLSVEGGQFPLALLASAAHRRQVRYFAIDRDPSALRLAERLVRFSTRGKCSERFSMKTACVDSLDSLPRSWPSMFRAIIGNPPWDGSGRSTANATRRHTDLTGRSDVYLDFILRAHELLAPGGFLSFVLPNAFLFNVSAAHVRRLLLTHYDLLSLHVYPQRSFVEVPCLIPISFLARKRYPQATRHRPATIIVYPPARLGGRERPEGERRIHGHIWRRLPAHTFNPLAGPGVKFLVDLRSTRQLLDFGELWSGGRLARKLAVSAPFSFRGIHARDIRPFHVCPRQLRSFEPGTVAFDRVPKRALVGRHKVVFQDLRYTTHPERLVAAAAGSGLYPVSTASMFVPHDQDLVGFFEALLNSAFANAWYKSRDISRSIKLLYLQDLPIEHDEALWRTVSSLGRRCVLIRAAYHRQVSLCTLRHEDTYLLSQCPKLYKRLIECSRRIDEAIFDLYDLSKQQRHHIVALSAARAF